MLYFIISTLAFVLALVTIYWIHSRYHLDIIVEPADPPPAASRVSICIPARNEEHNIARCIESALAQDYPDFEVIVLDDRSADGTGQILRQLAARNDRLNVIHGSNLPAGWAGKPHALYQAASATAGEWLCFIDADTFLAPQALSACLAKAAATRADLFTVMTRQIMGTFWEKTVLPIVMTALSVGFSPRRVNDPKRRDAVANGQFILIRRSVYDAIGGHESVKDQIVEDKAIAEKVKWNGFRLIMADGRQLAQTRMYTSLETLWEGWTKNIYLGLRDHPSLLLLGAFGAIVAVIAALFLPFWPLLGVVWYLNGGGWLALGVIIKSLVVWSALLLARALAARGMGISPWYTFTTPLGAGVFAAMMLTSAWKVLSGKGVTWKGRSYVP